MDINKRNELLNKMSIVDTRTGEKHTLSEVQDLTGCEFDDEDLEEAYVNLSNLAEFSCEILFEEMKEFAENLQRGIEAGLGCLEDDKKPNPIYIPKHLQHRKKGRR